MAVQPKKELGKSFANAPKSSFISMISKQQKWPIYGHFPKLIGFTSICYCIVRPSLVAGSWSVPQSFFLLHFSFLQAQFSSFPQKWSLCRERSSQLLHSLHWHSQIDSTEWDHFHHIGNSERWRKSHQKHISTGGFGTWLFGSLIISLFILLIHTILGSSREHHPF